jgi:hypothetical protein
MTEKERMIPNSMRNRMTAFAITALLTATGFAQRATTTETPKKPLTIQHRKHNQQARIRQGVKSGELSRHETRNLEKKERALNQEERDMRKMNNGKLTAQDRKTLQQQQNHLSKQIYKEKHNKHKRG